MALSPLHMSAVLSTEEYLKFQRIMLLMKFALRTKRVLKFNHVIIVLKAGCFLVSL